VSDLYDLACNAGCKVFYPFQGYDIGPFRILSPSKATYLYLLPQFDKTPDPDQEAIGAASMWLGKESLAKKLLEAAKAKVQSWTKETWEMERLKDGGLTSASNESSVVLYGAFEKGPASLVRLYYRQTLESVGFEVEEALNGLEARALSISRPCRAPSPDRSLTFALGSDRSENKRFLYKNP